MRLADRGAGRLRTDRISRVGLQAAGRLFSSAMQELGSYLPESARA